MSIEELKSKMHEYLSNQKTAMQNTAKKLREVGEEEEAELEMGRLAVYDIFGTMLEASALKAKMNPKYASSDKVKAFTQEYLMTVITQPAEWRVKYAKSMEEGEHQEIELDELLLLTVREIK